MAAAAVDASIPQYCGCYDCVSELMVYSAYLEVAGVAGRPDLADVRAVAAEYARHARARSMRMPALLRPPTSSAADVLATEATAAVKACKAARKAKAKIGEGRPPRASEASLSDNASTK